MSIEQTNDIEKLKQAVLEYKISRKSFKYVDSPKVTMILQCFNKRPNIRTIIERLRLTPAEELIVIDDGSIDGSYEDWPNLLIRANDFLIRSNDLYEVRMYDRAIRMARGELVCLLQDDDIPPDNGEWVKQAIQLFETLPKLLILGGRQGVTLHVEQEAIAYDVHSSPCYREPKTNLLFEFIEEVNRAPVFIRREAFLALGGIDQQYAPYHCDDADSSLTAWLNGHQVGIYACPGFARDVNVGGMRLFNIDKQELLEVGIDIPNNWPKIYRKFGYLVKTDFFKKLVGEANRGLKKVAEPQLISSRVVGLQGLMIRATHALQSNQTDKALETLNQAKNQAKASKLAMLGLDYLRAVCLLRLNQLDLAWQALSEELQVFPNHTEAKNLLQQLQVHYPHLNGKTSNNCVVESTVLKEFLQDDQVASGLHGQLWQTERFQLYYALCKLLPTTSLPVRFIQIGADAGALFLACQALKRVTPHFQGFAIEPGHHPQLLEVLKHVHPYVTHLPMLSPQAVPQLQQQFARDGNFPLFIFVDGDHTYEGVWRDAMDYFQLLAPGGLMVFHDYLPPLTNENREAILFHHGGKEPGVRQAFEELVECTYGEVVEIPLLSPTDPTQTQAYLPIIPGVVSTIRAYRKAMI